MKQYELLNKIEEFNERGEEISNSVDEIGRLSFFEDENLSLKLNEQIKLGRTAEFQDEPAVETFKSLINKLIKPRILQLGHVPGNLGSSQNHRDWFKTECDFVLAHYDSGDDVDLVCDFYNLSKTIEQESFDCIFLLGFLGKFRYPWLVIEEVSKCLKIDGYLFVQDYFTQPLNNYPEDFFRFTPSALRSLLPEEFGFKHLSAGCEFPCVVAAKDKLDVPISKAYLNSCILVQKSEHKKSKLDYRKLV